MLRELHRAGWQSRLYEIKIGGDATRALIRDVQFHPVTDAPEHVDFQRLAAGEPIRVPVPVHFENEGTQPRPEARRRAERRAPRGRGRTAIRTTSRSSSPPISAALDINDTVRWHDLKGTEGTRAGDRRPRLRGRDRRAADQDGRGRGRDAAAAAPAAAAGRRGGRGARRARRRPRRRRQAGGAERGRATLIVTGAAMLLWVGLGNPEPGMARNRHNIGFMAVDMIAIRHGFSPWRQRFKGLVRRGQRRRREDAGAEAADLHERLGRSRAGGGGVLQAAARGDHRVPRRTRPGARQGAGEARRRRGRAQRAAQHGPHAGHAGLLAGAARHRPSRHRRSGCWATCSSDFAKADATGWCRCWMRWRTPRRCWRRASRRTS